MTYILQSLLILSLLHAGLARTHGQQTIITSQTLRLVEGIDFDNFYFQGDVEVLGEDFFVSCEHLHVVSRAETPSTAGPKLQMGKIETMEASGNVYIRQEAKQAWSQEAEVLPDEEKMILRGKARLKDERGTVNGHRITLFKGQKEAIVEGGPEEKRPTLILQQFPSQKESKEAPETAQNTQKAET